MRTEQRFDPRYKVLNNLVDDKTGLSVGYEIALKMVFGRLFAQHDTRGFLWLGEGGSGKTTAESQAVQEAVELAGKKTITLTIHGKKRDYTRNNLLVTYIAYDLRYVRENQRMEEVGIYLPRKDWGNEEWGRVSDNLFDDLNLAITNSYPSEKHEGAYKIPDLDFERKVVVSDIVAMGPLNKGKTAVAGLAARPSGDVEVYAIVTDPLNKLKAIDVRETVSKLKPSEIIEVLKKQFNIHLHMDNAKNHPEIIEELVSKMADRDLMEASNIQVDQQIDEWTMDGLIDPESVRLPDRVVSHLMDPATLRPYKGKDLYAHVDDVYLINWYKRRVAHMRHHLYTELGVARERGFVLYNLHNPNIPIHWFQDALDTRKT